jgi:hypothetical protein
LKVRADSLGVAYPRVLIVGDANEGGEPEKNQVEVLHFADPSGACYYGDPIVCPTDDMTADFDDDFLSDMQLARLPLSHRWKVARSVENFLNKAEVSMPTDRAVFAVGDLEWQGVSPESLPELMTDLMSTFEANGYEVRYMKESDYSIYNRETRQLAMADTLNEGVDIVVNMGTLSNRSRLAGDFIQKVLPPAWDMDWLDSSGPRPFVFFGPSCDIDYFDRDNPVYDPTLADMFLSNDPAKPSAVAWISQGRGHWMTWYRVFAEEFVWWLFSGETTDVLDCFWKAKRSCWVKYPRMHDFLRSVFYLGWPVRIRGNCEAGVEAVTLSPAEVALDVYPNPGIGGATVRFGLPAAGNVRLAVYDVLGRTVTRVAESWYEAGWHSVVWEGRNSNGERVAPGAYFVRLNAGERETTRKVLLVR